MAKDSGYVPRPLPPIVAPHPLLPKELRDSLFGPPALAGGDVATGREGRRGPWNDPEAYGVDSAFASRFTEVCEGGGRWLLTLRDRPGRQDLETLRIPVLIIEGARERERAGTEFARFLPNTTHSVLPGGGHDPWYNDPERFFDEVSRFLRSQ